MNSSVLVVGSVAFDDVKTPFEERKNSLGGSAIFFSVAASHFTRVNLVGVAGNDYPHDAIKMLRDHNIDTQGLKITAGKTFRWGGTYHDDINIRDTRYTHLNVFADFKPIIPEEYRQSPFLFLGNIQPSLQLDVLDQLENPRFTALDTMNLWIETTRPDLIKVISRVDLLLINDSELNLLTGELGLLKGLEKVHEMGPKYVVIKKGEHGAYLSYMNSLFFVPAYPVYQPSDPTGAGDSFAGGFLGYLAGCDNINFRVMKKAIVYGSAMGAFAVEHFSVDGLVNLDRNKINARFSALRQMVLL
ncbi:MAG: sugar kinase [Candidatus Marinimicrobia bacterium]|nr:sugar kinase [Candidatus Neomarinimicrobiota bacterium]